MDTKHWMHSGVIQAKYWHVNFIMKSDNLYLLIIYYDNALSIYICNHIVDNFYVLVTCH